MPELSGAQAFVCCLEKMGVQQIYGIIGTSILGFFDGLFEKREKIRYISCRHEQVAASMADARGRLTGKPGVAVVHSGPGALNAAIGVANALKDCSPMILVTGAIKSRLKGCDGMLELDHTKVFAPLAKATWRVERARDIPRIISEAFLTCLTGAFGPVVIEVPENIWKEKDVINPEECRLDTPLPQKPDAEDMEELFTALTKASRPLVLAGCGIASAGAVDIFREWIELADIPVITTGNGRGLLPEDHPLSLGRVGFGGGNPVADEAYQKSDLIAGLGCGISDMTTYEYTQQTSADIFLVNLDPNAAQKMAYVEKNILGDAREAIAILLKKTREKKIFPFSPWIHTLKESKAQWAGLLSSAAQRSSLPVSPCLVFSKLNNLLPQDCIVCGGAGMHVVYANDYLVARTARQFLAAVNFGSMGFGMASAMSAKLVYPAREVVAVLGDGEFLMTAQDLETVVREKIAIRIIVVNDNSYRVLEYKQKLQHHGRVIGTRHGNPDFMKLAEAFGLKGIRIRSPDEVEKGLKDFMSEGGPVLMEIVADPEDLPPTNLSAVLKMGQG